MLVSYHFPLFDARTFTRYRADQRSGPDWPTPINIVDDVFEPSEAFDGAPFQRCFGPVQIRKRGGLPGWIGETCQCKVTSVAFWIDRDDDFEISRVSRFPVRNVFSRFFQDGQSVGKFDFGFIVEASKVIGRDHPIESVFDKIENASVSCKHDDAGNRRFEQLPDLLSDLYSGPNIDDEQSSIAAALVNVGKPVRLVVVRGADLNGSTGKEYLRRLLSRKAKDLRWSTYRGGQVGYTKSLKSIPTFFFFPGDSDKQEIHLRECRIAFSRVYTEVFAFFIATKMLRGKLKPEADEEGRKLLLDFINRAMRRLTGRERPIRDTDHDFYQFVLASFFEAFHPGILENIVDQAAKLGGRSNLIRSIERLGQLPVEFVEDLESPIIAMGDIKVTNKQTGIKISGKNVEFSADDINIEQTLSSASSEDISKEISSLINATAGDAPNDAELLKEAKEKAEAGDESWIDVLQRVSMQTLKKASELGLPILTALIKKQLGL
ncbi:MAG: hypothetical protein AAF724_03640 [Pseudomonadota bacterium]